MSFSVVQSSTSFPRYTLGSLPPTPDVALGTTTNIAYEMTKQGGQGGGQEGEHAYELMKLVGGPPVGGEDMYEIPSPPSPQHPATVSSEGGTGWEGDVVYENIPGDHTTRDV